MPQPTSYCITAPGVRLLLPPPWPGPAALPGPWSRCWLLLLLRCMCCQLAELGSAAAAAAAAAATAPATPGEAEEARCLELPPLYLGGGINMNTDARVCVSRGRLRDTQGSILQGQYDHKMVRAGGTMSLVCTNDLCVSARETNAAQDSRMLSLADSALLF